MALNPSLAAFLVMQAVSNPLLPSAPTPTPPSRECIKEAALYANVEHELLMAISFIESRWNQSAINQSNKNGTEDICAMQINSIHYERLSTINISRQKLLDDHCTCFFAGAHILKEMIDYKGQTWEAVAAYNGGLNPPAASRAYAAKVKIIYDRLKQQQKPADEIRQQEPFPVINDQQ